MPTGFLSEMSAEPVHGGGITLQRILGENLGQFDWYAKTAHHPTERWPVYPTGYRHHCYPYWRIESVLRPLIRCRLAYRVAFHPLTRRAFARDVARRLLRDQPDLLDSRILVCPQADTSVLVLEEFKKISRVRYVTWVMDDHCLKWRDGDWVYPNRFERLMKRHLQDAEHVHVISPALQDFYRQRFGVDSNVLCGPAARMASRSRPATADKYIKLVYFGSLGPWQNDAIELLVPALEQGRVSLDVFSYNLDAIPPALKSAGAQLRAGVSAAEVANLAGQYHAVVLPVSFGAAKRNMSFFNIATKFSECLAFGIPTLLIGPSDAVMVKVAAQNQAAVIVDRREPTAVSAALDLVSNPREAGQIVAAALDLVEREFSPAVMSSRFELSRSFLFSGITS